MTIEVMKTIDGTKTYTTDNIVCPWCGYEHRDSWEMSDGDYECHGCEKPISVTSYSSREITTSKGKVKEA
jgi:transposase-like protein